MYQATARYEALLINEENKPILNEWGVVVDESMGLMGLWVIRDAQSLTVSAILTPENFVLQYVEES